MTPYNQITQRIPAIVLRITVRPLFTMIERDAKIEQKRKIFIDLFYSK